LQAEMQKDALPGTIVFYGCPAEETGVGKVFMARAGVYDDLDCSLTWHPGAFNAVTMSSTNAVDSVKWTFYGRAAHAAGNPDQGRSALDAVELMNIGVNYLREHVLQDARIHYVTTKGGGEPNVVPAEAREARHGMAARDGGPGGGIDEWAELGRGLPDRLVEAAVQHGPGGEPWHRRRLTCDGWFAALRRVRPGPGGARGLTGAEQEQDGEDPSAGAQHGAIVLGAAPRSK
jgi:hypothetical protein